MGGYCERKIAASGGDGLAEILLRVNMFGLSETQEAMEIGTRDAKAACRHGLVAIVLANGRDGEPDLVIAELAFKGT